MLEPKYKVIFELLKRSLFMEQKFADIDWQHFELPADVTWEQIYKEMRMQAVAELTVDWAMENLPLSNELKQTWQTAAVLAVRRWLHIMNEQEAVTNLLNGKAIEFAIIKGASAALEYPRPENRIMGDIDLVVKKERIYEIYQLLLDNGYKDKGTNRLDEKILQECYHVELIKNGVEIEVHWGLIAKRQKGGQENYLAELLHAGLDHREIRMLEGYHVVMFPCVLNGLILLRHIMQHLQETALGLRQIIDWMMFVNAHVNDEAWKAKFQPLFSKMELEKLAIHVTRMCQLYLGLREEGITWCQAADPALCEEILDVVMASGNYGMKTQKRNKGIRTMLMYQNFFKVLKNLHRNGIKSWPLARKYPVLRPLAGVYQLGRYIELIFKKDSPIKSMRNLYDKSKRLEVMLERLDIGWKIQQDMER